MSPPSPMALRPYLPHFIYPLIWVPAFAHISSSFGGHQTCTHRHWPRALCTLQIQTCQQPHLFFPQCMRKNMRGFTNYNESFLLVISSFEKKTNYFQKFMEKFKTKIVLKKEQSNYV
jgi:hypothetical protein